jgi:translocation and assembly module TamA
LLSIPFTLIFNTTGQDSPLEDATHGIRASFNETPTLSLGTKNAKFFITQGNFSYYFDLHVLHLNSDPGRSILAFHALAGLAQGAGQFSLPPDQRFYAGGSGTIRGYRYQSVGPQFDDGNPIGGTAINAGQAVNPLDSTLRFGAGAGVRYYTPIGPIRLDIGVPINREGGGVTQGYIAGDQITRSKGDAFEIYIGLGQSF